MGKIKHIVITVLNCVLLLVPKRHLASSSIERNVVCHGAGRVVIHAAYHRSIWTLITNRIQLEFERTASLHLIDLVDILVKTRHV